MISTDSIILTLSLKKCSFISNSNYKIGEEGHEESCLEPSNHLHRGFLIYYQLFDANLFAFETAEISFFLFKRLYQLLGLFLL